MSSGRRPRTRTILRYGLTTVVLIAVGWLFALALAQNWEQVQAADLRPNGLMVVAVVVFAAAVPVSGLLWGAIGVFREAGGQLMDHELPEKDRGRIIALMTADPRIQDVHQLRTRASGPYVHIQMHADLDPDSTLAAAHEAVVAAEKRVLEAFPAADIIIHADPRGRAEPHGGAFGETEPPSR